MSTPQDGLSPDNFGESKEIQGENYPASDRLPDERLADASHSEIESTYYLRSLFWTAWVQMAFALLVFCLERSGKLFFLALYAIGPLGLHAYARGKWIAATGVLNLLLGVLLCFIALGSLSGVFEEYYSPKGPILLGTVLSLLLPLTAICCLFNAYRLFIFEIQRPPRRSGQ